MCVDETFVRSIVDDLKGIELDWIKVGSDTPQKNRQYAQEAMMKVNVSFSFLMQIYCLGRCI